MRIIGRIFDRIYNNIFLYVLTLYGISVIIVFGILKILGAI